MRAAIEVAREGAQHGEPPFGAVIVDAAGGEIVRNHDRVVACRDWTRHAETDAVRAACSRRGPSLGGCTLVTTCEPCPMCFTAAWLAGVDRLVFGCTMADVARVTRGAQIELAVPAADMNARSGRPMTLCGGVLADECLALFEAG
jgi:tRNA(Arg) A34 adenosine deaminase TadA